MTVKAIRTEAMPSDSLLELGTPTSTELGTKGVVMICQCACTMLPHLCCLNTSHWMKDGQEPFLSRLVMLDLLDLLDLD